MVKSILSARPTPKQNEGGGEQGGGERGISSGAEKSVECPKKRSEKGTAKKTGKNYSIGNHPAKVAVNRWLASTIGGIMEEEGLSTPLSGCIEALSGYEVVVWDMDHTMSAMHCGDGLKMEELPR